MKIHTTQNLSLLKDKQPTNLSVSQYELSVPRMRDKNFNNMALSKTHAMSMVSFEGKKKPNSKDAKKIIDAVAKKLGDINEKAKPEVKKGDKILLSSFFDGLLKIADYETVVQAAIAAAICVVLRPLTILALPTNKPKDANAQKASDKTSEKAPEKSDDSVVADVKPAVAFKANRLNSHNNSKLTFKARPSIVGFEPEKTSDVSFKALFNKKSDKKAERNSDKTNNIYAASHSIASGIVGLITAFVLTAPFKLGADHVMKKMRKYLSESTLKRLYPHLNKDSIVKDGKRLDEKLWKNIDGKAFSDKIDDCDKLPVFKQFAEVSKETFEKVFGLKVDFASQKGESFNNLKVTKDGKSMTLYDAIDFRHLGIKVKEDGHKDAQILLMDLDKEYFEMLIKDTQDDFFKGLDVNSVFDEKGIIKDFREWKEIKTGNQWKLDLDRISVNSPLESADYQLRISGKKRLDAKDGWKFVTYQKNGENGRLGSEITDEMLDAEKNNAALTKALTWLPDIAFRVPVAVGTIALIPWILKNVFGIEKKKPAAPQQEIAKPVVEQVATEKANDTANVSFKGNKKQNNSNNNPFGSNVNFRGGKPNVKPSWFTKFTDKLGEKLGEFCAKPLIESQRMANISARLAKLPGDITQHMMTLGSFMMSSVYVQRTLSNKDMDDDRKKTLAINQTLCFIIPTIAAYTVDSIITNFVKNIKYRYTGLKEHEIAIAKFNKKPVEKLTEVLGKKIKGVSIVSKLATFTLIYRYLTPVLVTPAANKIGDKLNAKKAQKN